MQYHIEEMNRGWGRRFEETCGELAGTQQQLHDAEAELESHKSSLLGVHDMVALRVGGVAPPLQGVGLGLTVWWLSGAV